MAAPPSAGGAEAVLLDVPGLRVVRVAVAAHEPPQACWTSDHPTLVAFWRALLALDPWPRRLARPLHSEARGATHALWLPLDAPRSTLAGRLWPPALRVRAGREVLALADALLDEGVALAELAPHDLALDAAHGTVLSWAFPHGVHLVGLGADGVLAQPWVAQQARRWPLLGHLLNADAVWPGPVPLGVAGLNALTPWAAPPHVADAALRLGWAGAALLLWAVAGVTVHGAAGATASPPTLDASAASLVALHHALTVGHMHKTVGLAAAGSGLPHGLAELLRTALTPHPTLTLGTLRARLDAEVLALLEVVVVDHGGRGQADVPVRVLHTSGRGLPFPVAQAITDATGHASVGALLPGRYTVVVEVPGTGAPLPALDVLVQAPHSEAVLPLPAGRRGLWRWRR